MPSNVYSAKVWEILVRARTQYELVMCTTQYLVKINSRLKKKRFDAEAGDELDRGKTCGGRRSSSTRKPRTRTGLRISGGGARATAGELIITPCSCAPVK